MAVKPSAVHALDCSLSCLSTTLKLLVVFHLFIVATFYFSVEVVPQESAPFLESLRGNDENSPLREELASQESAPFLGKHGSEAEELKLEALRRKKDLESFNPGTLGRYKHFEFDYCDVPCLVETGSYRFQYKKVIPGSDLSLSGAFFMSMEGPKHYPRIEREDISKGYLATVSFHSTIPLPYFYWEGYNIQMAAIDPSTVIPGMSFIARNCASMNNREGLVNHLRKFIRVDGLSSCLNNAPWPDGINKRDKVGVQRNFLFHAAFENECSDDYITEKLWGTLASGSLAVYYGATNLRDHIPSDWAVNVNDFASWDDVSRYIVYLQKNLTAYMDYHRWRKNPLPRTFIHKYNFTRIHNQCRRCRYMYAKTNNLGWKHEEQEIDWKRGGIMESRHKPLSENVKFKPTELPVKHFADMKRIGIDPPNMTKEFWEWYKQK
eukprot:CAMPEP_0184019928 /NCGR_PEP_ID=MMETSP0954-20121128/9047_1 /TAXON_ID=627963 /ORGANISM="Aplanochytrium sp, Strain PBS07" /LENGTH=435 /DNA_ID=CAMNT_0026301695 /DNA_START=229 /DNA_END=1536 /DNA_ORIENTATION=-